MPIPPNVTALTAIEIPSLPYTNTQVADNAGTTYDLWYAYTSVTGDVELSIFGYGDAAVYAPEVVCYTGPASAPVVYLVTGATSYGNKPVQIPVTAGMLYLFKFVPNAGNPSPADFEIAVESFVQQAAPAGSIAINDDTTGFPLALMDITTDNTVLAFVQNIAAGEGGAILPDGTLLLEDNSSSDTLALYSADYTLITSIPTVNCEVISTNKGNTFYAGRIASGAETTTVTTITSSGGMGPTTWTLTGTQLVTGLAPSPDETILYYFREGGSNLAIKRWDLVSDIALSDLVAGVGVGFSLQKDLLCLSDGSIIVNVRSTGTSTSECRRYSDAGVLLDTYTLDYALSSGGDRMADGVDDSTFWVWLKDSAQTGTVIQIRVSDGAVLSETLFRNFEAGIFQGTATPTPDAFYGPSFSCPFWITRTDFSPTPPTPVPPDSGLNGPAGLAALRGAGVLRNIPVVRLRAFPHLSDEMQRLFHKALQIDIESGVGTISGQGVLPDLRVRWSDDGGFTWSNGRTLGVGPRGAYTFECKTHALGSARDRVYEITQSDPVKTVWLAAYLDIEEGTN